MLVCPLKNSGMKTTERARCECRLFHFIFSPNQSNLPLTMHGLRRSIASFGSSWKGSRGLVVVRQSTDEYTRQRFDAKPVDFSVVTSMRSLEKYMKFHTMSWETDLKPAFSLPEEISQKMIASAKEARPCEVIPVTFAVSVLRACEASVCMEELMDVTSIRGPEEKLVTNPHSPLVQLDILHDTETEGSLETFPHESNHILSTNSSSAMKFRFDEMVKSLYIPRGEFHLSLNFPIRGSGFRWIQTLPHQPPSSNMTSPPIFYPLPLT